MSRTEPLAPQTKTASRPEASLERRGLSWRGLPESNNPPLRRSGRRSPSTTTQRPSRPGVALFALAIMLLLTGLSGTARADELTGVHATTRGVSAATSTARSNRQMARVGLFSNPETATISIDGEVMGQGKFVGYVPEGLHTVRFELDGHNTVEEQLTLKAEDGPGYLVVHMRPTAQPVVQLSGRQGGWVDEFNYDIAAWSLTGAGGLMLVGGIVMLAIDGQPACSGAAAECPKIFETTGGGVTLTTLGSIALTSGVILFLWDELAGEQPEPDRAWQVGVAPIGEKSTEPEGATVLFQGRW